MKRKREEEPFTTSQRPPTPSSQAINVELNQFFLDILCEFRPVSPYLLHSPPLFLLSAHLPILPRRCFFLLCCPGNLRTYSVFFLLRRRYSVARPPFPSVFQKKGKEEMPPEIGGNEILAMKKRKKRREKDFRGGTFCYKSFWLRAVQTVLRRSSNLDNCLRESIRAFSLFTRAQGRRSEGNITAKGLIAAAS